jgi:sphingolipid 4-desaturase/C4-monooxygenase
VRVQVGYHNEHHDFPSIPWTRLPALKALAPEYYDTLPSHPSWPMVTYNFIFDSNVGMWSRVKRVPAGARTPSMGGGSPGKGGRTPEVGSPVEEKANGLLRGYQE